MSEHLYGACLTALEVTGAKSLARCELISCTQDRFRRVTASFPNQLVSRGGGEAVFGEEPLRPQTVVLFYGAQHVSAGHLVPGHHVFITPGSLWGAFPATANFPRLASSDALIGAPPAG